MGCCWPGHSLRRTHNEFQRLEQSPYTTGIAIVDPNTPDRLLDKMPRLKESDVVQISTLDDAWSPEARQAKNRSHKLGN